MFEGIRSHPIIFSALDGFNKWFGRGTVKVSTKVANKRWQMKQERESPSYTTDWASAHQV
jgi:DNA polymerase V